MNNINQPNVNNNEKSNIKYICKFYLQIEGDKEFQVIKRIIGAKGSNLKRIIDYCSKGPGGVYIPDAIKLKLKGVGSGYREKVGDRKDHHINGAIIGREILEKYTSDKELIDRVVNCIYNHRSSKNATNIEEICVCDADILAHFDNIPLLFYSGIYRGKLELKDAKVWVKEKLEKDYDDLSSETKKEFTDKYNEIMKVIFHE